MSYKIVEHRLVADSPEDRPVIFQASPNHGGPLVEPALLVMHYTAGRSAQSAARWLSNPDAKASAHLVIGKGGEVIQLVPFDRIAWHAGKSSWNGIDGVNKVSLGVELDNAGRLAHAENHWRALGTGVDYPLSEGLLLTHKAEDKPSGWHVYPATQLETALEIALLLVKEYGLKEVVGHEDVAPGRKSDPGPAFAMESFRSRLFGRSDDVA